MSLTGLLKSDDAVIRLFNTIPDLSALFKTIGYHAESFPRYIRPLSPRIKQADASIVGTAYDFWFRAYIQFLNGNFSEGELSSVIVAGLSLMEDDKVLPNHQMKAFRQDIHNIWQLRNQYMKGFAINEDELIYGCFRLAYCEAYYRSRHNTSNRKNIDYFSVDNVNMEDIYQLIHLTKQNQWMFTTKKQMFFNPTFSHYSKLVGGADADFIIGETIFDIKTTTYYKYNREYIAQLIGYYLLSEYDKSFPVQVKQLALFYARYGKIIYISIDDIKKIYNLDSLSKYFYQIVVYNNRDNILKMNEEKFNNKFSVFISN